MVCCCGHGSCLHCSLSATHPEALQLVLGPLQEGAQVAAQVTVPAHTGLLADARLQQGPGLGQVLDNGGVHDGA